MFPFRKRKKKPKQQNSPWVLLLVVAFVAYSVISNDKKTPKPATPNDAANTIKVTDGDNTAATETPETSPVQSIKDDAKTLKGKFLPQSVTKLQIKDNIEGSGQFAICGQKVTISYSSTTEDKKDIESTHDVAFQIGENKVMPALEIGVIGMKKNGERTISAPPIMAYGADNFLRKDFVDANADFEVKMLEISPELPDSGIYRVLGDGKGSQEGYVCGSEVKLHVALWNVEGKKIYSSRDNNDSPISFTIGKSEVFLGLEQGVLDMLPGMRRNLIVPPNYQKTLLGNPPTINFPLPKNQIVLVDVEAVSE